MSKPAMPGMERGIEHIRKSAPQGAGKQSTDHLEQNVLGWLVVNSGEGVPPSGESTYGAMGSAR